ncbi:MAG: Rieske 2Fe-2S domain-containing protein [Candidatus Promineifilaceae bacterium]
MERLRNLTRRDFLGIATGAIAAFIGAGMAVPAIAYILGPALKREETEEWIRLGSVSKVETGTPSLFKVQLERQTGWIVDTQEASFYVLTEDGRSYIAMSNICTHLGCRVRWIDEEDNFFCPCHNAVFDKDGQVVSGPPPRPLDRLEVKVENDQLFVKGG